VGRARIIQCITLSKAFGVYGGAVLGTKTLREKILSRSRAFIGCTPLPLPLANAALESVRILRRERQLRTQLHRNASRVKSALRRAGLAIPELPGPIVALHPQSGIEARALRRRLLAVGIYPPFLKYAGAGNGFFRFVISSGHTRGELDCLVRALRNG
jgi:7-keto-8-aminopelargonate synthetase-like enzyme